MPVSVSWKVVLMAVVIAIIMILMLRKLIVKLVTKEQVMLSSILQPHYSRRHKGFPEIDQKAQGSILRLP